MKVLVLGVTGMLGHSVFEGLSSNDTLDVWGTMRNPLGMAYFPEEWCEKLIPNIDVLDNDMLISVIHKCLPDVVINAVGVIKHVTNTNDPLLTLPINAMLPHRLAKICGLANARLIHISTDCVFSGRKGMYREEDVSDAEDLYGKSKYIGEVDNMPHVLTLRTSIIGHELNSHRSLLDWFLSQRGRVHGYTKWIFSGLPTVEFSRVISDYVLPYPEIHGLYHLSVDPIDKCSLLQLVADVYQKEIEIVPNSDIVINRSLESSKFRLVSGYQPPSWRNLIQDLRQQWTRRLNSALWVKRGLKDKRGEMTRDFE
ncbi:MAG: SDR family oxidoreductase [Mariprofundales bacterium]|nr:SDR family oxidoreductase [Mariprofundales bacterium]